ncbi:MAG: bifunctional homocysteine S-methyltransferase/methylenetetrahydrofolate reductase [Candidatus Delongbacteria bacterium]|nr:bifunctional homocysteine S-methyltransferase/methylenetetrahydrofolate reductase [Candidatus Delongbacteria bacterium]MBN2834449.1 bifunctional homocysteine S-methyltransferase/methylenetetrahydrofolate reductase [Candidatus Delongbacteria bacterium]
MKRVDFLKRFEKGPLLCDGGMGTELYRKGIYINRCYESINIDNPSIISEIHQNFIDAGADIIETNTFGANRILLSMHGLADKVRDINAKGVEIAKESARDSDVLVAGSVGPTGTFSALISKYSDEEIIDIFEEQISALIEAGCDLIIYETFNSQKELDLAVRACRNIEKDIPIAAMMTFPNKMETIFGVSIKDISILMNDMDIDLAGVNCSTGPERALDLIVEYAKYSNHRLMVMPNAGYPKNIDGRMMYMANAELFGNYAAYYLEAGVSVVGGCCGTTPEFIKQMAKSVKQKKINLNLQKFENSKHELHNAQEPVKFEEKSKISKMIADKEMVYSMEVLPPKSPNMSSTVEIVNRYKEIFHTVNIPDGPRASARMSIGAVAYIIQRDCEVEPIVHYCCRDRNILGIQSDLLGMHALGLKNVLAITGDPPKLGNYPDATPVFDVDAIGLVKILDGLNRGLDIAGNSIGEKTSFMIAVGANPAHENFEYEVNRLKQKIEAGAELVMTQPIYDNEIFQKFYEAVKPFNIPIMLGIAPLTSYKSAEFQNNEIPGMNVPETVLQKLKDAKDKEEALQVGIDLSLEIIRANYDKICGIYFMTQGKIGRKAARIIMEEIKKFELEK